MKEYTSFGWRDKENGVINHYGVLLDLNTPTTGVYSNNQIEFLMDELYDGINLTFEEWFEDHIITCENCQNDEYCDELEFYESYNDTYLIGSWIKNKYNLYEPDKSGEYSAIVGEIYTQVIWSKYFGRGALCSPCYPGQVDVDTPGDFIYYALPPDIIGDL